MKNFLTSLFFLLAGFMPIFAQTPYPIGHHSEDPGYIDASRNNRAIWTEVYYPATTAGDDVPVAAGQFPVLVFGHGFVIKWDAYDYIWEYFVAKGYICAFLRTEGTTSPNHSDFGKDMAFVANHFPTVLNTSSSLFQGHVKNKTAIMGHSMGGGSAFLACENNPNPTTFISLAAATTNPSSITAAANISIPSLTIAGTEDCVAPVGTAANPTHSLAMYQALPSTTCKYYVEMAGASHCQYTYGNVGGSADLCYSGEGVSCLFGWGPYITLQQQHDRLFLLTEPWLRYYLQGDCTGWTDYLANVASLNSSGAITQELNTCNISIPSTPTIAPVAAICEGDSATLTASSANTYSWSNGATTNPIHVNTAGSYTVSISNGVCTLTSAPVAVVVNANPPTPVITQNGNALTTSATGVTYQWLLNGNVVANTQSFSPTTNGNYILTVTNLNNNCSASSAAYSFTASSLSFGVLSADIQLFPNPTTHQLHVNIQLANREDITIELLDLQGKTLNSTALSGKEHYETQLSLEKYSQGVYLLKIIGEKGVAIQRIIKE